MKKLITILAILFSLSAFGQRAVSGKINVETVKEIIVSGDATKTIKIVMVTGDTIYGSFTDMVGDPGEGDNWGTQVVNRNSTLIGNGVTPLGVDTGFIATQFDLYNIDDFEADPVFSGYTNLISIGSLANSTGYLRNNGSGTFSYVTSPYTLPTASTSVKGGVQLSSTSSGLAMIGDIILQNDNYLPTATPTLTDYIGFASGGTQSKVTLNNLKTLLSGGGTVTSVAMTVPTGLSISGSPITSSGTLAISLASGYSIPTTANQTNWTTGYNDKINSLAFTGTNTKTLTLTQQDGGTVSNTFTDLDVQTLTADSTTTTIGLTVSGSNSRVHFNVDKSATNELNNSVSWNDGTNVLTVNDAGGNKTATITGFLESEVDGSTTNELQTISTTGAAGNISLSNGGGTLNLNVNDADASITNEIQTLVKDSTTITNGKRYGISISSGNRITVTDMDSYLGSSWFSTTNNSTNWNTAYSWGNHATAGYQTGTESYISNLSLSGNTLTSTGVGSAFNSTVGNIANVTSANIFTQDQTIAKASGVSALKIKDSGANVFSSLDADNGYFYVRNGKPYFINGDFGSTEIDLTPSSVSYPSAGIAVSTGSAWGTSIPNNSANWNTAYNDKVNSLSVTGTTTKTITLTQQDGGTVTGNFTDNDTYTALVSNGGLGVSGSSLYLSNINASGTAPLLTDYMWASPSSSTTVKSFTLQTLKDLIGTSYTLPLAANGTRGGIQIGYTSTANNFALQLSSEKAYTALPNATTSVKGIASFNSGNFSVSSGAVSVATGGIGAMNLANSVISGQVDIGSDIVDTDEFLISDAGTLRRMDASRLKTYIGGFADPMTTVGDIIFRNSSNVTTRLPIGTGDYVLKSYMGTPSWQPIISGTTSGAIPFNNGSGDLANDGNYFKYNISTNTLYSDTVVVATEVYDPVRWNGDMTVPTKDAIRDKIETMQTSYDTYYVNDIITLTSGVNGYINIYTSPSSTASTIYAIIDIHVDYGNRTYTHSSGNFSSYFTGASIVKQNWVESYHDFLTTDVSIIPEIVDNGSTSSTFRIKLNTTVSSSYHYVLSIKYMHKL